MRRWHRNAATTAAALCLAGSVVAAPASQAVTRPLAPQTMWEMVADPDLRHTWVAAGDEGLFVTDAAGDTVAHLQLGRVTSVALGPDGAAWAALPDVGKIISISGSTLQVTRTWTIPGGLCPGSVAVTGRFIVFGYDCWTWTPNNVWPSGEGIGVIDTGSGSIRTKQIGLMQPIVATSPGLPGRALATSYASYSTSLMLLDVSTGIPQIVTSRYMQIAINTDLAISPDGTEVAVSDRQEVVVHSYATSDLSERTVYQLDNQPSAVEWSADGSTLVATAGSTVVDGAAFSRGVPAPRSRITYDPGPDRWPATRSLAVSRDGRTIHVGSRAMWEMTTHLEILGTRPAAVTATAPGQITAGGSVRVSGLVSLDGRPAPAGTPVHVVRTENYGPTADLGTFLTGSDGSFTLADVPPGISAKTYTVTYAGDRTHVRASAAVQVRLLKATTSLTIAWEPATKGARGTGTVVVRLGPTLDNRIVQVTTQGNNYPRTLFSGPMGNVLRLPYRVTVNTTFVAFYAGSDRQDWARAQVSVVR